MHELVFVYMFTKEDLEIESINNKYF